jgi:hypothetical protein
MTSVTFGIFGTSVTNGFGVGLAPVLLQLDGGLVARGLVLRGGCSVSAWSVVWRGT